MPATTGKQPTTCRAVAFTPDCRRLHVKQSLRLELCRASLVDGLGLLPAALSTRVGAQAQRPLAIVVIGGAISIALLTRVFHPTLVYVFHKQLGLTDEGERLEAPEEF